ncbi:hypothetical protein F441_09319 [Phytophthora nicotianae CJ01A1]|uniref:Uncharacterized protein n=2 Tax=Phytophthora nicotianae TaxID=4792 RepID=V9F654_PHYNI|nr:hypothetical protein F443_09361 [Phytophthora nicotianae P1569]ETP16038.1 hypothetical protein F441_09319 [Phytophthora nicotianae CJ01A1]
MQYHTADDSWSYAESFNSTTIGGVANQTLLNLHVGLKSGGVVEEFSSPMRP